MTSSLVGSEMCIRDSINSGMLMELPWRGFCSGSRIARACRTYIEESVSYTHQTLPTICSV
eukprot:2654066-Prorocentrum_lima.AAC.1